MGYFLGRIAPALAGDNPRDVRLGYAEFSTERDGTSMLFTGQSSYGAHLIQREAVDAASLSPRIPPLLNRILDILDVAAEKEMHGVDTWRVIATVADEKMVRKRPERDQVSHTMRGNVLPSELEPSVLAIGTETTP